MDPPIQSFRDIIPPNTALHHSLTTRDTHDDPLEPFITNSSDHSLKHYRTWSSQHSRPSWYPSILGGLIIAVSVLGINIGVLIWIYLRFDVVDNIAAVFIGSCSKSNGIISWAELAINIMSTLLLAASNNCCQLLLSPTRAEVDKAHARGRWIHIGAISLGNIRWIARWRIGLWAVLIGSSVPLHLLYNSVIFTSSFTTDHLTPVVTQKFVDGGYWNENATLKDYNGFITLDAMDLNSSVISGNRTSPKFYSGLFENVTNSYISAITDLQNSISNLTRLNNTECQKSFGNIGSHFPYSNALIVTNFTQNDSWIMGKMSRAKKEDERTAYDPWFNASGDATRQRAEGEVVCGGSTIYPVPSGQSLWDYSHGDMWNFPVCNLSALPRPKASPAYVQYCLVETSDEAFERCSVSMSPALLLTVVICNAVKVICFLSILLATKFHPLATAGDAVQSFLDRPDSTTSGCGPESLSTISKLPSGKNSFHESIESRGDSQALVWTGKVYKWIFAVISVSCGFGMMTTVLGWLGILIILAQGWKGSLLASWSHNIAYSKVSDDLSAKALAYEVMLVNSPQLLLSLFYIFFTSLLSRMLVTDELSKFGLMRRGLRVSRPVGSQRSTFWLRMPYKYVIPIMASTAFLHWFISRGIFLVFIKVYNIAGQEVSSRARVSFGTSGLALLFAFLIGTKMIALMIWIMNWKFDPRVPLLGTSSFAISAACHPVLGDEDAATKPLMYGIIPASEGDNPKRRHVCFTSKTIEPFQVGERYF